MRIELKKFGTTLLSRQAGSEALKAFQADLRNLAETESLEIDFNGIFTFTPSWADEFITPLVEKLSKRLILLPTDNTAVNTTIQFLDSIRKK